MFFGRIEPLQHQSADRPDVPVVSRIESCIANVLFDLERGTFVIHKGIQYNIAPTVDPDVWHWQFQIDGTLRTGKTKTRLAAMASRRVQLRIDAALKRSGARSSELPDLP
jgi:hypothetical protein